MKKIYWTVGIFIALTSAHSVNAKDSYSADELTKTVVSSMAAEGTSVNAAQIIKIRDAIKLQLKIAELARLEGVADLEGTRQLLYLQENQVLMQEYLRIKMQGYQPSDAELQAIYDKQMDAVREYHARHILVKSESKAKDIIARLNAGESFAALAKQSLDKTNNKNGGDLGWQPASLWVATFADALSGLTKGEFTQTPVKTEFGYHVIELLDAPRMPRDVVLPSFKEAKPQLIEMAKQERATALQEELAKAP
ncbi:MAG: peptidylprolyl isomerase [Formosimonas sp.]|jgi:peptidyl-prolyl cis-trans isomerase C